MTLLTSRDTLENSSLLLTDEEKMVQNLKLHVVDTDQFFAHTARENLLVLFQVNV